MSNQTQAKNTDNRPCGCDIMFETKNSPYLCTRKESPYNKRPFNFLSADSVCIFFPPAFGQLTLKKWVDPHRIRSPFLTGVSRDISTPFTQVRAPPHGVTVRVPMTSPELLTSSWQLAVFISTTQCSFWIPTPLSWMSGLLGAPARPITVEGLCIFKLKKKPWNLVQIFRNFGG